MPVEEKRDLTHLAVPRRQEFIMQSAEQCETALREIYPESDGYRYRTEEFSLYGKHPDVKGRALEVRKGLYWGYHVGILPGDYSINSIRAVLRPSQRLNDNLVPAVMALGLLAGIGAAAYIRAAGDLRFRDSVFAFVVVGFLAGIALFFILKSLSGMLVRRHTDPQQSRAEQEKIREKLKRIINREQPAL
jgi:hypothetical protein